MSFIEGGASFSLCSWNVAFSRLIRASCPHPCVREEFVSISTVDRPDAAQEKGACWPASKAAIAEGVPSPGPARHAGQVV